ncbi:hypothetical protein [Candidatus Binatus sp.]|uniref:hypothetical protein n=1 Tax=Candidatus Binatus sp. TaxID=2811406 RepID=UPI003BB095DF
MTTTLIRNRRTGIHSARLGNHAKDSDMPGREAALNRLTGELVTAFFIAMAVMWVVTTIAGAFA